MSYYFPDNIFTKLIYSKLPEPIKSSVEFISASLISKKLEEDETASGLIPTMDLIQHKDFYVSQSFGVSFESSLCNTYIYFNPEQKDVSEIYLYGDISSLEVILAKLIFKEAYSVDVKINMLTDLKKAEDRNVLVTGDVNFLLGKFYNGISFSEELIDVLSVPYVNYVFASKDKVMIEEFNKAVKGISRSVYNAVEDDNFGIDFSDETKQHIRDNISSFICEFDEQDIEGIKQLIRLPYFHGIIKEILEVRLA